MQLARLPLALATVVAALVATTRVVWAADQGTPPPEDKRVETAPAAPSAPASSESEPEVAKERSVDGRIAVEVAAYVDSNNVEVLTPSVGARLSSPTSGWSANGNYLVDIVSAASPDIVSTASPHWVEVRHAGSLGASYKPDTFGIALGGATSYTPDYLALSGSGQLSWDLNQKNSTLVAGYGYGHDTIGRVGTPFSVFSRTLEYHSINAGLSQVVNASVVIGVFADAIIERGDQSKPYRYIPIFKSKTDADQFGPGASPNDIAEVRIGARPLEQLPLERERGALTGRLAWRFTHSTLRVEERLYGDTWALLASTTDLRYYVDVSERIMIWPHLRANAQNSVSFWQRTYVGTIDNLPALRTGDRELSALVSGTAGGGLRWGLGKPGRVDDFVLQATLDGVYTQFLDALYVTNRIAGLFATTMEIAF